MKEFVNFESKQFHFQFVFCSESHQMAKQLSVLLFILCVVEAICWINVFASRSADPSQSQWTERDNSNLKLAHHNLPSSKASFSSSTVARVRWLFEDWRFFTIFVIILAIFGLSSEKIRTKLPSSFSKRLAYLEYFTHPKEVLDMFYFKLTQKLPQIPPNLNENDQWCFKKLIQVSRSFSAPILALDPELSIPVCLISLIHFHIFTESYFMNF
jgi:hypothetical protein